MKRAEMAEDVRAGVRYGLWTPDEDEVLRSRYETEGAEVVARALGRSLNSVFHRTGMLKLFTHRRWTQVEDRRLQMMWGELPLATIAERLKRKPMSIYTRANEIGLERGAPQGTEYLRVAARRTGFDVATLRNILRWAGVKTQPAVSRPIKGARYHFHIVDTGDVDDAVERWLACETMNEAARARGMNGETLAAWLEESGLEMPKRPRGGRRWRVPSDIIDRVIAERADWESAKSGAKRAGVGRSLLIRLLAAAGVARTGYHWRVRKADVDRVVAAYRETRRRTEAA